MSQKMDRFLNSIGLNDIERFDLDFALVGRDKSNKNKVLLSIIKDTPWDYALLQEFQMALGNITYQYSIRFSYNMGPTSSSVTSLFEAWYFDTYHGISPFTFGKEKKGVISVNLPSSLDKKSALAIISDFNALLSFYTYPFSLIIDEQASAAPTQKNDEPLEEECIEESIEEKDEEVHEDENNDTNEEVEASPAPVPNEVLAKEKASAEKEYLSVIKQQKFTFAGSYCPLKSIEEIFSLQPMNVEFSGQIFEASCKLSRRGSMMGTYGIGDDKSAISLKAFERKDGLSSTDISAVKVGDNYKIRGEIGFDKYTGERIVTARFMDKLPPKELRSDPYPNKRVELHLHSKMSAMDGVGEMEDYCALAEHMGMKALAVTDHGDIQSFPAAQKAAKDHHLKMIYGCEFYMFDPLPKYVFNPTPTLLSTATYCVFDLETTGLSSMFDRITEFGGVIVRNGAVKERLDILINPGCVIPEFIEQKTHITNEMVKDKPHIEDVIEQITKFIGDNIMVSHNASFDFGFLNESRKRCGFEPLKNPVIDTLALSHYLFPDKRYHNLGSLSKNLNLSTYNDDEAHRADFDAEALSYVWEAILPRINPDNKKTHADLESLAFDEFSYPNLSTNELNVLRSSFYKNLHANHMIALVKNAEGLKDMYRLISLSNTQYLADVPKIPKSELQHYRKNLIFGSACFNGDVFDAAIYRSYSELKEVMSFYDYIELQPVENYSYLINMGTLTKERVMEVLKTIVKAADEIKKPLVATGDVHYVNPEDKICRDVYISAKAIGGSRHPLNPNRRDKMPLFPNPDQHFRSTKEMVDSFSKWLPIDKCEEIIIKNSNAVADQVEPVFPVKPDIFPPNANLPDSAERLKEICYKNLYEKYGDNPDPKVKERLDRELEGIIGHGYSVTYYIAHCIIKKANAEGYIVGSRGSVGSSFAATMADITEVNPLAPHYLCPKCKHFEWNQDPSIRSGFDLPAKKCPVCGTLMEGNGQDIPFETFLGFKADKVPDIDLNFPPDYQARAHAYTRELLGPKNVFRAGTIETVAEKIAFGFVRGYYERIGMNPDKVNKAQIAKVASKCTGVKRTTGQHPGGIVVIPSDMDVFDFTPYQHPADDLSSDWLTTHYEFASMHDEVLKLDLLGHVDPLALRKLSLLTKKDILTIPMNDPKVISLFSSPKALNMKHNPLDFQTGAVALPEFGTNFVQGLLKEARPKTFNELLIVSGLSHGTDVWNNNAEDLIKNKTATLSGVIGCRDDIMNFLIGKGVPNDMSFKIMEYVRKNKIGNPIKPEFIQIMKEHNVPNYYIESCKKIRYLFPRAHATAYVMGAVRMAWFKLYMPLDFYAIYFTVRCDKWDLKTMLKGLDAIYAEIKEFQERSQSKIKPLSPKEEEILKSLIAASEMLERGYHFENIDIYRSEAADFVVDEEKKALIPPFVVIEGLGEAAGQSVVEARKNGKFISKEDLDERTKLSETNINDLSELGALDGMGENNQMSLFENF
jgi:DNA polymerase-3 subunit alpha (Gram-positive type)